MDIEKIVENLYTWALSRGVKIIFALIFLIVGWKVIKRLSKAFDNFFNNRGFDQTLHSFLNGIFKLFLELILILFVMDYLGINTTGFATVLASAGVAASLGLKESLSNLVGGIILLMLRPFKVGDLIQTGDNCGTVDKISIFYTEITTVDNNEILVPNGTIVNSTIVNYSLKDTRRLDVTFGVGYESDIRHVKSVLQGIVEKDERILKDPEPFISISEHGDNAILFLVRVWTHNEDYSKVRFSLLEEAKIRFDEEGINIPYPQMEVYIKNKEQ